MGLFRFAALAVVVLAVSGVYLRTPLTRLFRVVTLFYPSKIGLNFRTSTEWGVPSRVIHHGAKVATLGPSEQKALPVSFVDPSGHTHILDTWLRNHSTTGLVVLKIDGPTKARVLNEQYMLGNDASSSAISWSMGKSVVSAAFGVAVERGLIGDIEKETVEQYLPQLKGTGYDGVVLKNVLQMSSGIGFNEDYFALFSDINMMGYWIALGFDIDSFVARLKRERNPGEFNHYVSMDTQVLGMVLSAATNQTLASFIEETIWSRGGFESDASVLLDNEEHGMELSFGTMGARTRDYARFGWLFLNMGKSPATGEQIVPRSWVEQSTRPDAPHLMPDAYPEKSDSVFFGYGYQWWLGPSVIDPSKPCRDYMAIGVYNQFIAVFPEQGIVIAKNSAWADYAKDPKFQSEMEAFAAFRTIADAFANQ